MKTLKYLLIMLVAGLAACNKSEVSEMPDPPELLTMGQILQEPSHPAILNYQISNRSAHQDCPAPACENYIEEYADSLRLLANESCLPVMDCIECCLNNWLAYVTLEVFPSSIACPQIFEKQVQNE